MVEDMSIPCSIILSGVQNTEKMNITVRQSRQSGVARATCPD